MIAHKNKLGKNLMMMLRYYPEDYNFFPETYLLPYELYEFRNLFKPKEEPIKEEVVKNLNDQTPKKLPKKGEESIKLPVTELSAIKDGNKDNRVNLSNKKVKKTGSSRGVQQPQEPPQEKPLFIVKPECQSQGKGIFLTRTWEDINPHDHVVA